jgi:hypothetical protein
MFGVRVNHSADGEQTGNGRVVHLRVTGMLIFALVREGFMRVHFICFCIVGTFALLSAQQPQMPTAFGERKSGASPEESRLLETWEGRIKSEWEAIKNKDKKAYGELLADDYQGVEVDGKGERNKLQAMNELSAGNVFAYTLWGLKLVPAGTDSVLVIYEVTMQFPPKAQVRYSRVYISELWMKRAGEWKEVHYQETHVK